jgi:hypothetical protein
MPFDGPVEDRLAILELCRSYGDAVSRHDIGEWNALWIDEGQWSHPDIGAYRGLEAISKAVAAAMEANPLLVFTSQLGSLQVTGDCAEGRDYTSELVTNSQGETFRMTGLYEDRYVKRDGRWLFEARRFQILHVG